MDGIDRARRVLPLPGGPLMSRLCPPCRRDLQCAFGVFLAAYVREIGPTGRPNAVGRRLIDLEGVSVDGGHAARPGEYLLFAAQVGYGLCQGADGNHLDIVHEPGLAGVGLRDEDTLEPLLLGDGGHRKDAVGVPELTVQGQLAEEHGQRRRAGELSRSHQDGQGYGQIVRRALPFAGRRARGWPRCGASGTHSRSS